MATITTRYSIGDTVYHAGTATEKRQHDCPDCLGSKRWSAKSPAGDEFAFPCPRCNARYSGWDEMSLDYTAFAPRVQCLTIGSVRYDSNSFNEGERYEYMCTETGVGSGQIYRERDLFPTEEEALRSAELKAASQNETTPWIAKRYNRTLEISDYQFSGALLKRAEEEKSKARSLVWNIADLFATIRDASDKEAILEAVEEYERWTMDDDRAAASVGRNPKGENTEECLSAEHEHAVPNEDSGDAQTHPNEIKDKPQ